MPWAWYKAHDLYVYHKRIGVLARVQLFGGRGIHCTSPKAGCPDFCAEQTVTINATVIGSSAALGAQDSR